ncbi:MAG: AAA family ATPase [Candidatus Thermoplasmatota archaeon]|nr:AAA family ATPase [Candidatus Thermoplasmatota archaeon]
MGKNISAENFKSLVDYYIDSLEKEDMFSITFNIGDNNKKFVINPSKKEIFFYENNERIKLPRSILPETFTEKIINTQKQKSVFYGYPLVINTYDKISPLFFIELTVTTQENSLVLLKKTKTEINHAILSTFGFEIEEIHKLRLEIQENNFDEQITAILDLLHLPKTHISSTLDTKLPGEFQTPQILNKTILYTGERTGITRNLIRELRRLKQLPYGEVIATSLGFFLGEKIQKNSKKALTKQLLEVFPLNNSQQQAVEHALTYPLTVITGPPGTGKSQVVLNIIANAVFQDKTILFSSKNNKAVDVVREKLQPVLTKPLIVRMGAELYRKEAKETISKLFPHTNVQNLDEQISKQTHILIQISNEISIVNNHIQKMREISNAIDETQDKMYLILQNFPPEMYQICKEENFKKIDVSNLENNLKNFDENPNLLYKLMRKIFPKKYNKKIQQLFKTCYSALGAESQVYFEKTFDQDNVKKILHWILSAAQIVSAKKNIIQLKKDLTEFEPTDKLHDKLNHLRSERTKISRTIFDLYWLGKLNATDSFDQEAVARFLYVSEQLEKYIDATTFRKLYSEWKKKIQQILCFLPVWVITNLSARNSIPLENNLFDILIIDEASQCDIASALPLFYRAKNVVIIGDPKQLKHISLISQDQDIQIADKNNIKHLFNDYSYVKNSLYDLADKTSIANKVKPILLDEHYRCTRNIISFSNEHFYEKLLHIHTDELRLKPSTEQLAHGIIWRDVCGKTIRSESSYNIEEADVVVENLKQLTKTCGPNVSYGVVTFFRAQMELIRQKIESIENLKTMDITIGTSHRFQGDEKDVIIFSPAVSSGVKDCTLKWIHSTSQLLNVAITRAKTTVMVIGDKKTCLKAKGVLGELVSYVEVPRQDCSVLDTDCKQTFYNGLHKNKIRTIPGYSVRCKNNKKYQIDFALFVNKSKYALDILDTFQDEYSSFDFNRYNDLRSEGWKIRQIQSNEILNNFDGLIENMKRLC